MRRVIPFLVAVAVAWSTMAQVPRYLATDLDELKLNHEGNGRRSAGAAHAAPAWFEEHMRYMTRDGGRWIADNGKYRSEAEPFDAYGTEWRWGPGKRSVTGRLFGLRDGEEQGTFWEFRLVWHPAEGRAVVYQFGAGALASGTMTRTGPGETRIDQTFFAPDGSRSRVVHRTTETSESVHVTKSFDVGEDGSTTPRRTYTWSLAPDG